MMNIVYCATRTDAMLRHSSEAEVVRVRVNYTANLYSDGELVVFADGYKVYSTSIHGKMKLFKLSMDTVYPTYATVCRNGATYLSLIDEESGYCVATFKTHDPLEFIEEHEFMMVKFMER